MDRAVEELMERMEAEQAVGGEPNPLLMRMLEAAARAVERVGGAAAILSFFCSHAALYVCACSYALEPLTLNFAAL